jgi:hypothetical protein
MPSVVDRLGLSAGAHYARLVVVTQSGASGAGLRLAMSSDEQPCRTGRPPGPASGPFRP